MLHDVNLGFVRALALLPAVNAAFDGMNSSSDCLLDGIRRQIGFLVESVVERTSGFRVRRDAVFVVSVVPTIVAGFVRAVEELLGGFVEVVVVLVGDGKFNRCGASDLHISDVCPAVPNGGESEYYSSVGCLSPRRLPLRPTRVVLPTERRKPSLLEAGGSASETLKQFPERRFSLV